ncbi:uncharacterized protein LOC144149420 [Haemaphysalis longicornis]
MRTSVLFAVLAASLITAEGTSKLLPAVRASLSLGSTLLRHLAHVKDRLREDVERHLLRNAEHTYPVHLFKLPSWHKSVLARPWVSPQFHTSFSYQAAGAGGLPVLPLPFFPQPLRPAVVLVPCRYPRTHIAQVIFPCIRVIAPVGLGAPQISVVQGTTGNETNATETNVTTSGHGGNDIFPRVRTTTVANEDLEEEFQEEVAGNSTTVVPITRVTDTEATTSSVQSTVETTTSDSAASDANTRATDVTTTSEEGTTFTDAGTTAKGVTTTEAPLQSTDSSATEPDDRQANTMPDSTQRPTTTGQGSSTAGVSDYAGWPTDSVDFNDILKGAPVSFGKLDYE